MQPLPVQSDEGQGSQDTTTRLGGEPQPNPEPAVPHQSRTAKQSDISTAKIPDQAGITHHSDRRRGVGAFESPATDETGAPNGNTESLIWAKGVQALKEELLKLETKAAEESTKLSRQSSLDEENGTSTSPFEVHNGQLVLNQYKGSLENLHTHRRHWEPTQGPGQWYTSYGEPLRRHPVLRIPSEMGSFEKSRHAEYSSNPIRPANPFERPKLSKFMADDVAEFSQSGNYQKQKFDTSMEYGRRRERLRQNFECDLDRLHMEEEVHLMRADEAEKARIAEDGDEKETNLDKPDPDKSASQPEPTVELRYVDWYTYGDWYRARRLDDIAIVEVLLGEPIDFEMGPRQREHYYEVRPLMRRKPRGYKWPSRIMNGRGQLPERVRIHSQALITIMEKLLAKDRGGLRIDGQNSPRLPLVVVRPFKALVYCYDKLQKLAASLEKLFAEKVESKQEADRITAQSVTLSEAQTSKASENEENHETGPTETSSEESQNEEEDDGETSEGEDFDIDDSLKEPTVLLHLQYLLKFLNEDVLSRREYLRDQKCSRAWFSDMDLLFSPGTYVIEETGKQAYRVIDIQTPKHHRDPNTWARDAPCKILCMYIDFDGKTIGPVARTFEIPKFDGEKDIALLPVYPIRFCNFWGRRNLRDPQWEKAEGLPYLKFRHSLVARGQKFLDAAAFKQMYYTGPTLDNGEEVESQVVIDFEAAFSVGNIFEKKYRPQVQSLREIFESLNEEDQDTSTDAGSDDESERARNEGDDDESVCHGNCCFGQQVLAEDANVSHRRRADFLRSLLPRAQAFGTQASINLFPRTLGDLLLAGQPAVSADEFLIMPSRVFGFILRNRKWGKLPSKSLSFRDLSTT